MNADGDLLFGLLALQLNFIDRQQLVAAFDRWSVEKRASIGQILQENDALSPDEHQLLVALVAKHLERHGGAADRSLAALTPLDSARDDLKRLGILDLQASLVHVSAQRRNTDPGSTVSFAVGESTSEGTRFRILRPHARGGLGEVFVARDEELHREVALKEILQSQAHDANARERFLLEAEITGGLEHPGIVPVYGLGTYADGRPFYAMRFIKGDSLAEAIKWFHGASHDPTAYELGLRKLLGRLIDVCNAIDYAHSRGVLHRDLKPGNIMLGKYGETLVVDWGLAKVVGRGDQQRGEGEHTLRPTAGSGSAPTEFGHVIGTPEFMSPEQAEGRLDEMGPPSDVYSLGATLYMLLTGRAPFAKNSDPRDVVARVAKGDFPRPRQIKPDVPQGLEAVCLTAMALKPADRYPSPRALAEDLEHWLADEPVWALPDTLSERAARWSRRHRALTRSAAAALAAISLVSVIAVIVVENARRNERSARELADQSADRERREARRADDENRKAQLAERNAEQAAEREKVHRIEAERHARISATLHLASQSELIRAERPVRSTLLALEAMEMADQRDTASLTVARQALRDALEHIGGQPLAGYASYRDSSPLAFSPDGRWLVAPSDDSSFRVWDMAGADLNASSLALRNITGWLNLSAFSPDSRWLAAAYFDTVKLWDLGAEKPFSAHRTLAHPGARVSSMKFSRDGRWLAAFGDYKSNHTIRLWDLTAQNPAERTFEANTAVIPDGGAEGAWFFEFSADSHWLASAIGQDSVKLWNLRADDSMSNSVALRGTGGAGAAPKLNSDGHWLISGCDDGAICVWDLTAPDPNERILALKDLEGIVQELAFSGDGRWLVTATDRGTQLWDLKTGQAAKRLILDHGIVESHPQNRWFLAFSPDGNSLITALDSPNAKNKTARLWNLTAKDPAANPIQLANDDRELNLDQFAFSPDSRRLATGSFEGDVLLWDLKAAEAGPPAATWRGHQAPIGVLTFSPDSHWLATAGATEARLWDLSAAEPIAASRLLRGHETTIRRATFSPDGQSLATESYEDARLWNLAGDQTVAGAVILRGQSLSEFSKDGRRLTTLEFDGESFSTHSWDLHDACWPIELAKTSSANSNDQIDALSPDGRWLALASKDGAVWLRDLTKNAVPPGIISLNADLKSASFLGFSPDSRYLVAAGGRDAQIWDMSAPERPSKSIAVDESSRYSVFAFSADGRWLVAWGFLNGAIRLWALGDKDAAPGGVALTSEMDSISSVTFSPDIRWLTATGDSVARLWDLHANPPTAAAFPDDGGLDQVRSFAFSPDVRWLATMGDKGARLWSLRSNSPSSVSLSFDGEKDKTRWLAFSPDSRQIAIELGDAQIRLCKLDSPNPAADSLLFESNADWSSVSPFEFSPNGRWLAGETIAGEVVLWDVTTKDRPGKYLLLRGSESSTIRSDLAFSPDSRWLAKEGDDRTLLWDLAANDPTVSSIALAGSMQHLLELICFSPDSRWLAAGGMSFSKPNDSSSCLWLIDENELRGHAVAVAGRELTIEEREQFLIPSDASYVKRGMEFCELEEWQRAEADFARAAELDAENDMLALYLLALTRLASGDAAAYRRGWLDLYERFKKAEDDEAIDAIGFGLIVGSPEPALSAEVLRLTKRYAAKDPARKPILAGALYRGGDFAEAVTALAAAAQNSPLNGSELLLLSMAQFRCSQVTEAKETYNAAEVWIDEANVKDLWKSWSESFEAERLHEEAHRLLQGALNGSPP